MRAVPQRASKRECSGRLAWIMRPLARIGLAELAKGSPGEQQLRSRLTASPTIGAELNLSNEERVLACVSCHQVNDVHSGNFGQNCVVCHETKTWFIADYVHPSPSARQCGQCHTPSLCHFHGGLSEDDGTNGWRRRCTARAVLLLSQDHKLVRFCKVDRKPSLES